MTSGKPTASPVLHVVVIGFHHKKGNQVEFSFPPLIQGNSVESNDLPEVWKHLPSLALPDGAHNYNKDTVYFHLPSNDDTSNKTVFGVSCYRQINAKELINPGADVTRNSVQKSVCVLSTLPLYGLIEAKLELITHAYFKERDFAEVSLLEETFTNLNHSLSTELLMGTQVFLGLSCRDVVHIFRNRILILFKLMLLERRVLFFSSPVKPTVNLMLAVLSLLPGMIEQGLDESACYSPRRQLSPTMKMTRAHSNDDTSEEFLEVHYTSPSGNSEGIVEGNMVASDSKLPKLTGNPSSQKCSVVDEQPKSDKSMVTCSGITDVPTIQKSLKDDPDNMSSSLSRNTSDPLTQLDDITYRSNVQSVSGEMQGSELETALPDAGTVAKMEEMLEEEDACFSWEDDKLLLEIESELDANTPVSDELKAAQQGPSKAPIDGSNSNTMGSPEISEDTVPTQRSPEKLGSKLKDRFSSLWQGQAGNGVELQDMRPVSPTTLEIDDMGFPLSIFTKGMLCHPYLCLQYYDLLSDVNIRGFVFGATNALFKQKKHMIDVVIELVDTDGNPDGRIEVVDPELRKQLSLSTADIRFADSIAKAVIGDSDDTEWEGGDEWIRSQFKTYLTSMLASAQNGEEATTQDFNSNFISAWKTTHNYKVWKSGSHDGIDKVDNRHPCHGQLGVGDVKLKFAHTMQSTDKGKKINAALGTTGRAVGGAFNIAKKSVSSWFTSIKDWNQQENNESNEPPEEYNPTG